MGRVPTFSFFRWYGVEPYGASRYGCEMQDTGCKIQDARCRIQDARCRMQDAGCKMQDNAYPVCAFFGT
jgi:hypothetical protein